MSWRSVTEADVRSAINSAEDLSTRAKHLSGGQGDPLPDIIGQVTREVREAIRSHPDNRLSPGADEVPEGAIHHAVAIIRHRLLSRFDIQIGEARLMEYREATAYLKDVAAGKRAVENPDAGEAAPAPAPFLAINPRQSRRLDG